MGRIRKPAENFTLAQKLYDKKGFKAAHGTYYGILAQMKKMKKEGREQSEEYINAYGLSSVLGKMLGLY